MTSITGNPGLIGYYQKFLQTLHSKLNGGLADAKADTEVGVDVYGNSLAGFELSSKPIVSRLSVINYLYPGYFLLTPC